MNQSLLILIKEFASVAGKRKMLALFYEMKQLINQVYSTGDNLRERERANRHFR